MDYTIALKQDLKRDIKRLLAAVLHYNEGKVTKKQLKRTAQRASWNADRLLEDSWIHAQDLDLRAICQLFSPHCDPGRCFLADLDADSEREKQLIEEGSQVNLTFEFQERRLNHFDLHDPHSVINRKTRLDFLIRHVFEQLNGPIFSHVLSLETDVEFAYHDYENAAVMPETFYGVPYYSVWYGPPKGLSTNFVVVHTETPGFFDEATIHAYMSWIYQARVHLGKRHCAVYGLATDSYEFWFYKINDDGEWSHTVLKPNYDWYYNDIADLLGFIFHEAYLAAQETPNLRLNTISKLQVEKLPYPGTDEVSFEALSTLPEGTDTWIN